MIVHNEVPRVQLRIYSAGLQADSNLLQRNRKTIFRQPAQDKECALFLTAVSLTHSTLAHAILAYRDSFSTMRPITRLKALLIHYLDIFGFTEPHRAHHWAS
jgi:hypothetical protein